MHLTNYSVNKHSETFNNDDSCDKGSKRTIKFFNSWLSARGYCVSELWAKITVSVLCDVSYTVVLALQSKFS